jgi:hypothetical protein
VLRQRAFAWLCAQCPQGVYPLRFVPPKSEIRLRTYWRRLISASIAAMISWVLLGHYIRRPSISHIFHELEWCLNLRYHRLKSSLDLPCRSAPPEFGPGINLPADTVKFLHPEVLTRELLTSRRPLGSKFSRRRSTARCEPCAKAKTGVRS